jgi:hypothetical protein
MDEIFPDEIFLEIFGYLPSLDLYRAFYNLNIRLNRIISESHVYIRFVLSKDEQLHILPYIHQKKIRAFCVCEEEFQYSKLNQCINLRELEFSPGHVHNMFSYVHPQLVHVKPSIFPSLKKLTIRVHSSSSEYRELCIMIFDNQFPALRYVHLPFVSGSYLSSIKTWSTSLKYLRIQYCSQPMFYSLLVNLPNIKHFTGALCTHNGGPLKNQCLSLTNLNLETHYRSSPRGDCHSQIALSELIGLYQCLPNLEETYLSVFAARISLDHLIDHLNRVLSSCPKLKRFDCSIAYYQYNSVPIDQITKRYPLFENCAVWNWQVIKGYECRIVKC